VKEIKQRVDDLKHMLGQSQRDEIDENILIEPTAKLLILVAEELMSIRSLADELGSRTYMLARR
jgi:hypothetical protein